MKIGLILFALAVLGLAGFASYVRFAPVDGARWQQTGRPVIVGDTEGRNGFQAVRALSRPVPEVLAEIDRVILDTPRTRRIIGAADGLMVTYETRSRIWRFPDYTTVWVRDADPPLLGVYGRARFGLADLGVNKARVLGWVDRLDLGS